MPQLSAPIFCFGDLTALALEDSHIRPAVNAGPARIDGMLAMTGPSAKAEPGHLPVRGDLAHIKLAGICFVPHYAVPMPHALSVPSGLLAAARTDAAQICELPAGTVFNVLDIAGGWAWGQEGEDGFVGYLPMAVLIADGSTA
ncbi:SH3 domain-containing protein [Novosphingobium colocasiae]|uniref:Bacterial dipeptidyl-peptidase SH3 domain-containing protein n=1 Tax=Novosphingobium colocasiae TaxID=1256513 RepID=A0A918PES3_9SPHN|nr:SH3 domain-containing protein [Novosphingobium colocasiae]GGZ04566.1 hypothetical protein GCM10011614_19220 [Novosphingobium colocasiae]